MTVYVDDQRNRLGRMICCHMAADTTKELEAMARKLGLKPEWIQAKGTYREHYDVNLEKRAQAVHLGAVETTARFLVHLMQQRRPKRLIGGPGPDPAAFR